MSWASIAKAQPKPEAESSSVVLTAGSLRLLVVDANAIIDGVKLEGIADRAVTIQEVLDEIRDKQSRQYLANLPYVLEVSEPSDDSVQAVTRFARATGDVAALSTVDIKLLALVHTLEVAAHGADHLLTHPNQPRMHNKASFASEELPGWGSVPNPEDWRAVDEANDADEAALLEASSSRIARHVQQLTLDPSAPNSFMQDEGRGPSQQQPPSSTAAAGAAAAGAAGGGPAVVAPATPDSSVGGPRAAAAAASAPSAQDSSTQKLKQEQQQEEDAADAAADDAGAADGGDDGWEVAASSKGAARHRKRKAMKKQQHLQAFEQEWADHSQAVQAEQQQQDEEQQQQQQQEEQQQQQQQQPQQAAAVEAPAPASQAQQAEEEAADAASEDADADAGECSRNAADATNDELLAEQHCVHTADDGDQQQQQQQQQQGGGSAGSKPGSPGWQSNVAIITGDFAMQNVLLQMGLRLITKDGRRIARLTRYALRCSACFTVTREPGRLFCPKCGNLSLDRVEVVVGPDGAEYFGVTKRHILRGTRFSLPKPKGGRAADDLVLREDVFLQKVKALGKQALKKKAADAEEAAVAAGVDPFAPEYSQDTWHVASQQELAQHRGLAAVLQPAWKNNANERKLTRSNRRG